MVDDPRPVNSARVREHLANERTFLSWIRTSVAMMGFGFVVAKLRLELSPILHGHPIHMWQLGTIFAGAGIVTVLLATWRYFVVREMIDQGGYVPFGYRLTLFSLLIIVIGVAIIVDLVTMGTMGH